MPSSVSGLVTRRTDGSPAPGGPAGTMCETVLANGIRVLSEHIPGLRSATAGVWVRHGAVHDPAEASGAAHMLEHMVFKGTERRSAHEIALELESRGGSLDAFTSREHTCYQARVLDQHLPVALDVLADIVRRPALREDDLKLEREVVLEEIAEVEDTPDDLVFELHGERLWDGHPFGRSILGTTETVSGMPLGALRAVHGASYRGRRLVIGAAGNIHHEAFVEQVERLFGDIEPGEPPVPTPAPGSARTGEERVERDSAQSHLVFGTALPGHADSDRYGLVLLSSALGGGMSSRLFQRVREELGLCYSIFTFQSFYASCGMGGVYVGTRPATADRALDAVRAELARVAAEGLPTAELEQVKQQVKGQVMLSLESTGARLYRLTAFALYDEPWVGLDDLLARLDAVTGDQIARLADHYFHPDRQLVMRLGPA